MPNESVDPTDPIVASEEQIANVLQDWDLVVQTAAKQAKYAKRATRGLMLIVFVMAIFLGGLWLVYSKANNAIDAVHHSAVTACQQNNVTRIRNQRLWLHSLQPLIPKHPTAAQDRIIAAEVALIHKTFKLRNCEAENPLP